MGNEQRKNDMSILLQQDLRGDSEDNVGSESERKLKECTNT
jgi:hypothetical protein